MKLYIGREKLEGKSVVGFYDVIAEELGHDITDERIRYDCNKIYVSLDIQELFYESYEALWPEKFLWNRDSATLSVTMMLASGGPMINRKLEPYTVEIEEGFVTYVEKEEKEEESA